MYINISRGLFKCSNLISRRLSGTRPVLQAKCGLKSAPPSRFLVLPSVGRYAAIATGTAFATGASLLKSRAACEYKPSKSRLLETAADEPEPKFDWQEFFRLLWPDIWHLVGAVLSALAVAALNIQIPLLLGDVVNVVSALSRDGGGADGAAHFLEQIRKPALKLVYMYALQGGLTAAYISFLSALGERTATRLRTKLFNAIIRQDIAFFDKHKTGEVINRLTSDVQDFKSAFKLVISQGLRSTTQVVGCVASLALMSPKLTALLLLVVPSVIGLGTLLGAGLRGLSRRAQTQVARATAVADEAIANVRTVRAFAMEDTEAKLYEAEVEASSSLNQRLGLGIGLFQGVSNVALNAIVLGTLYAGGLLVAAEEIRPGDLMAFMVATQTVQRSLAQMSLLFGTAVRGMSAGARVFEYMSLVPKIPCTGGKTIPYHSMRGEIQFKDVSFSYPTRPEQQVLDQLNLSVPPGRVVALVGLSGGGKSTLASLLERFYDLDAGVITLDGHDLRDLDPSWLRGRAIGYISQEPVLFATSLLENIRYGRPGASDAEVVEAAKAANAHGFISGFPKGYHTVVGERGVTVSGGQKQRIAIARALIKRPSVLVLDEATSALDAESERVVQEALDQIVRGRTVVVIAHRLSTIRDADVIAVIAHGKVVELGTHDELWKKRGQYHRLIQQQQTEGAAPA